MKFKRGQVTIFIIIAIIVIALVALFFIFRNTLNIGGRPSHVDEISNFVQNCLENSSREVIYKIGQTGSSYFSPESSTLEGVTYYFYNQTNYIPSKKDLEKNISYFISEKTILCTKGFIDFPSYEVEREEVLINSFIEDEEVIIQMKYPLSITKGDSITLIEDFYTKIPVRLGIIYTSIEKIMDQSKAEVCLSCISKIAEQNDVYVNIFNNGGGTLTFIISDEYSQTNDIPFEFKFANRYD